VGGAGAAATGGGGGGGGGGLASAAAQPAALSSATPASTHAALARVPHGAGVDATPAGGFGRAMAQGLR